MLKSKFMIAEPAGGIFEPRLITFDFGDTLVSSEPTYLGRIALYLSELGYPRSEREVRTAYLKADLFSAEFLIPRAPFSPGEFQEVFGKRFFEELGLMEKAEEIGPPLTRKLIELRPKRVMVEGAWEILDRLREAGYPLAVISNNDGNTREKCAAVGIADYFFFILDSTLEGVMKPDPRIFRKAAGLASVRPDQILHVGDLFGCDVMGARSAGLSAVWLADSLINPPPLPGTKRISRMSELAGLLKL